MKKYIVFLLLIGVVSCGRMGYVGDAVTTAAITESPKLVEANPIIKKVGGDTPLGNAAASVFVKVVAEKAVEPVFKNHKKYPPNTGIAVINSTSWAATCWNVGMLGSMGEPVSAVIGALCGTMSWVYHKKNPKFIRTPKGSDKYWEKK